jgi:hypothetical protein
MKSFKQYINEYNQQANEPMVIPPYDDNVTPSPKPLQRPYHDLYLPTQIPGRRGWRPPWPIQGWSHPYLFGNPQEFPLFLANPSSPMMA